MRWQYGCALTAGILLGSACSGSVQGAPFNGEDGDFGDEIGGDSDVGGGDTGDTPGDTDAVRIDIFVAESRHGADDGTRCDDAHSATWFLTEGNWGSGAGQIGPGTVVGLCGIITSDLALRGSGTADARIVVDGTGATMSGTFEVIDRSYWQIQNVTWADGKDSELIVIQGGAHGVFSGNRADEFAGGDAVFFAQLPPEMPDDMVVSNNYIRTASTDFGDEQHDIIVTEGSSNVVIEGNYLEMRAGGSGASAHDDIIQTYEKGGASAGPPRDLVVRHNLIVMNANAAHDRSWMMIEALSGTNSIHHNVFLGLKGASEANGVAILGVSGATYRVYNNTFVAKDGASNNVLSLQGGGTADLRNNIIHTQGQTALYTAPDLTISRNNNLWFGPNIPGCGAEPDGLCGVEPLFTDYAENDFSLQAKSPAAQAGATLDTAYEQAVTAPATWPAPSLAKHTAPWCLGAVLP